MHHIHQTRGFVLGSSPFGEANRVFRILTEDLGLIHVTAQGVRLLKSKLRYSIHDFSYCDVCLVRGKEQWRITGAVGKSDLYLEFKSSPEVRLMFARVFSLLERLLPGEEKNERLFEYLVEAVNFAKGKETTKEFLRNFEYILVLRILSCLGYLGVSSDTSTFVETPYWSDDLLLKMESVVPKILSEINRSLKETQL